MIMATVKCKPLDRWGWTCPSCGNWNEEDDDPGYEETVVCSICAMVFEPEVTG